jgi:transcriptional regulator with XRE-family HTH domain
MDTIYERLRRIRNSLHLSQEYVAKTIGVTRTAIVEIEAGKRKISTDELAKFSELYQVSVEELMNGRANEMPVQMFARGFNELDDADQKEILNLIEFKKRMKEHKLDKL